MKEARVFELVMRAPHLNNMLARIPRSENANLHDMLQQQVEQDRAELVAAAEDMGEEMGQRYDAMVKDPGEFTCESFSRLAQATE